MNPRLVRRIVLPTIAVSALLLLVGGLAAWYLDRLQRNSSALLSESVTKVRAAEELELYSREIQDDLHQYLWTRETANLRAISGLDQEWRRRIAEAESLASEDDEKARIAQIKAGYTDFFVELERVMNGNQAAPQRDVVLRLVRDVGMKSIIEPAHEYRKLSRQRMEEASQQNQRIADRMGLGLLLLGLCGAVAGLLTGYGMARGIQQSIVQLSIPIRDATGKLSAVVGPIEVSSGQDFEELQAALHWMSERIGIVIDRLQDSLAAAARADRLATMGQLAAGLAHELRNPLMSMKLLVQSARKGGESASLDGRDLEILDEEILRLDGTITTVLDFARPPLPEKRPFSLQEVVQQTVALVSRRASPAGIRIACRIPEPALELVADPGQIRQVLLNLLLNALDAVRENGTVTIHVSRVAEADDGRPSAGRTESPWVRIEVADTGPGLPADIAERLFEPFVSTKDSGTGLGLAICRQIVEAHGGRITAANRAGGGATFVVELPPGGRVANVSDTPDH